MRHPGYVGGFVFTLTGPIAMGSYVALIPGAIAAVALVVRTYFEDKTLKAELDGYLEYAPKTKYRLLPYVW